MTYADAGLSNDPNLRLSAVQFELDDFFIRIGAIGISQRYIPGTPSRQFHTKGGFYYYYYDKNDYLLFNEHSGQIIYSYSYSAKGPDGKDTAGTKLYFAGPNGISEKASASLGRFEEPIVRKNPFFRSLGLYDSKQQRFYLIDFINGKVAAGPELAQGDRRRADGDRRRRLFWRIGWVSSTAKDVNGEWQAQTSIFARLC